MEIIGKEFGIECNLEELNILHKALSVLRAEIKNAPKKTWSEGYLEKVEALLENTKNYW